MLLTIGSSYKVNAMRSTKGTFDYWRKRVRKNTFTRKDGSKYTSPEYEVYMSLEGKQQRFKLESGNKDVAAEKALEIFMFSKANGAVATLEKYKQKAATNTESPTVGDFLGEIESLRLIKPKTFRTYSTKFRRVIGGAFKIPAPNSRFDSQGDGNHSWRCKIDSVKLSELNANRIMKWRAEYLKQLPQDPLSQQKAHITLTSLLRNSKALFSDKYLRSLSLKLPQNPFDGITIGGSTTRRYNSEADFLTLAQKAKDELYIEIEALPPIDPDNHYNSTLGRNQIASKREQFKILLLCLGCGLRRGEVDNLLWKNVDFRNNTINVAVTTFGGLKGSSSERSIDVDDEVMKLLKKFKKESISPFVIESNRPPKPESAYHFYRCKYHFKGLIDWLHAQGITQTNALHELRKEYGSQLTEQFGIYVASKALGHSEVTTTARSYLEKKGHKSVAIF